jgi:predicted amidohydrolase YtcJ
VRVNGARRSGGLREAHAHLVSLGESLGLVRLDACGSLAECLDLVGREAGRTAAPVGPPALPAVQGTSRWIRLTGARVEGWPEGRWPSLAELDRAAGGAPCVIMSFDHHAAAANSAALAAVGLRAGDRVAANGLVCGEPGGAATGLLMEEAAYRVWGAAEPSPAERVEQVLTALAELGRLGYTEVHDLHSQPWLGPVLAELERTGRLVTPDGETMTVALYPPVAGLEAVAAGRAGWESAQVRLAGGKVFADGTLNSRTALMLEPYRDHLPQWPRGRAMVGEGELEDAIRMAEGLGLHLAVHAIGDGAVRMVLDAIERAGGRGGGGSRTGPHRVEHCELIDGADVPRFARLGVACSVQPCHLLADIEALRRYLPHRLDRVLPLRELIDSGCRPGVGGLLWFGSDAPIVGADPRESVRAATQRRRAGAPEADAVAWEQRITPEEAWAGFTPRGSAGVGD